ncbi:MAG: glycosyltransferase family 4 protein [Chitinispirillaceae bacterium]|nr:glycosyltransferase family 4 protein [Chitinispirillaceae bacterium]
MNIAFFSKELPSDRPNGVSVQVDRLAASLVARGHQVTCFSFSPPPDHASYRIVQLPSVPATKTRRKFAPARAFKTVDRSGFDILHYHGDDYLCAGSRRRIRTFYGSARDEALHAKTPARFCYQALFHALEWISCLRQGTLAGISETTKRALPLIRHVIPCGVPLDRFSPDPPCKTSRPSILFIGDFKSRKQGDLLLRVFNETVLPAHPQTTLTVIGPASVTSPGVRCLARISEQELITEYRKAWICCLPGSYEGFGVPAIEAMACGTAVVAVRSAGTGEIINHRNSGLLCASRTLGAGLNEVLRDQVLRQQLVSDGVRAVKQYDIHEIARRYEMVYQGALDSIV